MELYRVPNRNESVRIVSCYRPFEGNVWILESDNGGTIARAFSQADFNTVVAKYALRVIKPCSNPQHWDETQYFCALCQEGA